MQIKKQAAYGAWQSPISASLAASSSRVLMEVESSSNNIYWLERCPEKAGRQVIMCLSSAGDIQAVTPSGFSARTRVHEYGGGNYVIHQDVIYFSNDTDQRWYRQNIGEEDPQPLTPVPEKTAALRYADGVVTHNGRWLIVVRESHGKSVENELVAIATDGSQRIKVLTRGYDFYAAPRLNQIGNRIAWICWNHPKMPWDGTELWLADLTPTLELINANKITGSVDEFASQPSFNHDGKLYFVSDKSGFGNIYCYDNERLKLICSMDADCDYPQWVFKIKTYDFLHSNQIVVIVTKKGEQTLGLIKEGRYSAFNLPFTDFIPTLAIQSNKILFIGASYDRFPTLACYDLKDKQFAILYESAFLTIDKKYFSTPQAIEFSTDNGKTAHGFYYAPHNDSYMTPKNEKPPLIVISHGGPTSASSTALNLKNQFWTSRGFAVLDVNYGGSTGYGKAYRERLKKKWGVVDVADCVNGAKFLVRERKVDSKRLIIRGSSAGGYTALCALIFYDVFSIGSSYFGIVDLEDFMDNTHKFESRYLETLVGKYPEEKALYKARSPIHYTDRLVCPIILLHGLEDQLVPPSQSEIMVTEINKKGLPYSYLTFEHEQHGFRDVETIKAALESELYFFSQFFDFKPADVLLPIKIENFNE
ncbi:MAG: prolyl oligopeptidase family serine peptidase [Coxiella-like endosymbiont]